MQFMGQRGAGCLQKYNKKTGYAREKRGKEESEKRRRMNEKKIATDEGGDQEKIISGT